MSQNTLIKNATLVNEGRSYAADVRIENQRIARIDPSISARETDRVIDAGGLHLLPGMIDDQVHFREPGMPDKADFSTESAAAVAGGITSVMDMPNTDPQTINQQAIEDKHARMQGRSHCNFGFYLGATNHNIDDIRGIDPALVCGVKVFMGASTGRMLVDSEDALDAIFAGTGLLIATHCEDSPTIEANEQRWREKYGEDVPIEAHAEIRSREACVKSSTLAIRLALKHDSRLHILHVSTADELALIADAKARSSRITAEACVHFLWFDESHYAARGTLIKCNPSIKSANDRLALLEAVRSGVLDVIATDHAPHLLSEKQSGYFNAPSGLPLVQTALPSLLTLVQRGQLDLHHTVDQCSHRVAQMFQVRDRGFIREGYYADLTLIDMNKPQRVDNNDMLYKCGWSPYHGDEFDVSVIRTWVNGQLAWDAGRLVTEPAGLPLQYHRESI